MASKKPEKGQKTDWIGLLKAAEVALKDTPEELKLKEAKELIVATRSYLKSASGILDDPGAARLLDSIESWLEVNQPENR